MKETVSALFVVGLLFVCGSAGLAEFDPVLMPSQAAKSTRRFSGTAATPPTPRLLEILAKPLDLDFVESPLEDVAALLRELLAVNVVLDERALQDYGITADEPVTLVIQGLPADQALSLLLDPLELDYVFSGAALKITTQDNARLAMYVQMHDVSDLSGPAAIDSLMPDELIDLIQNTLPEAMWMEYDGEGGSAQIAEGILVVKQDRKSQFEVEAFLSQLRGVREERQKGRPVDETPLVAYPVTSIRGTERQPAIAMSGLSEELVKVIRSSIEPGSWSDPSEEGRGLEEGRGAIWAVPGAVIVRHTPAVHSKVRAFLAPFSQHDQSPEKIGPGGGGFGGGAGGLGGVSGSGTGAGFFSVKCEAGTPN